MNWIEIKDSGNVNQIMAESTSDPSRFFVIFKHSTRCSTSRMAMNLFASEWTVKDPVYLVNVVESRGASNKVSDLFGVHHQSPQVIVIKNGVPVYNNSHSMIDAAQIIGLIHSEPS